MGLTFLEYTVEVELNLSTVKCSGTVLENNLLQLTSYPSTAVQYVIIVYLYKSVLETFDLLYPRNSTISLQ